MQSDNIELGAAAIMEGTSQVRTLGLGSVEAGEGRPDMYELAVRKRSLTFQPLERIPGDPAAPGAARHLGLTAGVICSRLATRA